MGKIKPSRWRKGCAILYLVMLLSLVPGWCGITAGEERPQVYTVDIENTVTMGTARHLARGLQMAEKNGAEAVVIRLNTPGGLVSATLEMLQDMSAARLPVITYVSPQGAIAASAGTFILLNGHIAAMAPGTTCGAAMPVTVVPTGEGTKAADQKTINFLAGHMKSIARERGRPADLAQKFVTDNLVLNNREALDQGVVDYNAETLEELLQKVHGATVQTGDRSRTLNTAGAQVSPVPMSINEKAVNLISNPTLAMILLTIGIYGLIIGFYSPGIFLPETLGAICLILGLSGMGLFQGNLSAGLLILLGIGLLVAELFTPTFGILGIGGVISLVLGILFFPVEPMMPKHWFTAFRYTALGVGIVGAGFLLMVVIGVSKLRRRRPMHGEREFEDARAVVTRELAPGGLVRLHGEVWQAISQNGHTIPAGSKVRVLERQGLSLVVDRPDEEDLHEEMPKEGK